MPSVKYFLNPMHVCLLRSWCIRWMFIKAQIYKERKRNIPSSFNPRQKGNLAKYLGRRKFIENKKEYWKWSWSLLRNAYIVYAHWVHPKLWIRSPGYQGQNNPPCGVYKLLIISKCFPILKILDNTFIRPLLSTYYGDIYVIRYWLFSAPDNVFTITPGYKGGNIQPFVWLILFNSE